MGQKLNSMTFQAWKMKFLKSMTWPVRTLLFGVNLLYYFKISTPEWVSEWGRHLHIKGRYTPGDKLQQHVAVTDHPMCTGRVTSCSNKGRPTSQQQIVSCVLENFCENLCLRDRILLLQQVAKNQIRLNLCDLLWRQNSVAATKIFTKILQYTRSDLLLQCVASPCCCNLSPNVYQPLNKSQCMAFFVHQDEKKWSL